MWRRMKTLNYNKTDSPHSPNKTASLLPDFVSSAIICFEEEILSHNSFKSEPTLSIFKYGGAEDRGVYNTRALLACSTGINFSEHKLNDVVNYTKLALLKIYHLESNIIQALP